MRYERGWYGNRSNVIKLIRIERLCLFLKEKIAIALLII